MTDSTDRYNWQQIWQALTADVTDFDASSTKHGFEPKGPGDVTKFRRSDNTWAVPPYPAAIFTKFFESTQQAITAAGSLTLAHGTGVTPKLFQTVLVCQTAEGNYSIGDIVVIQNGCTEDGTRQLGVSVVPDATNLNIRYGSNAGTFSLLDKTTGSGFIITNANWKAVFRAWA